MTHVDRVATRFASTATTINNIPARLHLRSDDGAHLVWLESAGTRVFEPDTPLPANILHELYAAVLRDRPRIEAQWVGEVMTPNRWLDIAIHQDVAVIIAYPAMVTAFRREVDLAAWAEALGVHGEVHAVVDADTNDIILIGDDGSTGTIPIWSVLWTTDTDPSISTYANEHPNELVVPF